MQVVAPYYMLQVLYFVILRITFPFCSNGGELFEYFDKFWPESVVVLLARSFCTIEGFVCSVSSGKCNLGVSALCPSQINSDQLLCWHYLLKHWLTRPSLPSLPPPPLAHDLSHWARLTIRYSNWQTAPSGWIFSSRHIVVLSFVFYLLIHL